jgi:hypothetical protein
VQDVGEPDELEQLDQAAVRAVEQRPTTAPGRDDLQPCYCIHHPEIGGYQPRDIEVDDVPAPLVLVVRLPHGRLLSAGRASRT